MSKRYLGGDIYFEQKENSQEFSEESSGGSSTLSGLTDVDISNPTDGQMLVYNAESGKWENGAASSGDALIVYVTEVTDYSAADADPPTWNGKLSITVDEAVAAYSPGTARPVFMLWPTFIPAAPYFNYSDSPTSLPTMTQLSSLDDFNVPSGSEIDSLEINEIDEDGYFLFSAYGIDIS